MKSNRLSGVILLLGFAAAGQAGTLTLGAAVGFNVFVFSDFSGSGTDAQGKMAVGGNFAPAGGGGFTIASGLSDPKTAYDLVVGGNFTDSGYTMNSGSAYVAGNMTWTSPTIAHNAYVGGSFTDTGGGSVGGISYVGAYNGPSGLKHSHIKSLPKAPIDFASAQTSLTSLSSSLAGDAANGTVNLSYSTYTLTGTDANLNVFDMAGAGISGTTINISAPSGSTVVVNVSGSSVSFNGGSINYSGGITQNNVIFNFDTASALTLNSIGFNGSILAPNANFTGVYGDIDGQLIADTATGTTEFHNVLFTGNLGNIVSATPEPGTWASLGAGCLLFAGLLFKRRGGIAAPRKPLLT